MRRYMPKNFAVSLMLLATLAFAVSCSKFGRPSDDVISNDIKARMFSDPTLKSANINVAVKDGVVTLSGEAADDAVRLAAEKLASDTKGAAKVNDQIVTTTAAAMPTPPPAAEPAPAPEPEKPAPKRSTKPRVKPSQEAQPPATPAPAESAQNNPAPAATPAPATPAPPPPPQPRTVTIPAGTILTVRTIDSIDSRTNHAGEIIHASLDAPIVVNNEVIVPSGADAYIKLVSASSEGRFSGRNELTLELTSVTFRGKTYNVVTSDVRQAGGSRGKNSAAKIGGGAAIGALIGAVAGGGKGAAIGAAVGGGAGAGLQGFKKGKDLKIPSETRLDFTLQSPLDITYVPGKRSRGTNPE
jgi:outer membrane biosynthesis protein TonB